MLLTGFLQEVQQLPPKADRNGNLPDKGLTVLRVEGLNVLSTLAMDFKEHVNQRISAEVQVRWKDSKPQVWLLALSPT